MELGSPEQPAVLAAAVQQVCQPSVLYWMVPCVIVQPPVTLAAIPVGTPGLALTFIWARRVGASVCNIPWRGYQYTARPAT